MIQRVTEADAVEVGRYYLVSCVPFKPFKNRPTEPGLVPVIGPAHEDHEILRFPYHHHHYDWRFMSAAEVEAVQGDYFNWLRPNRVVEPNALASVNFTPDGAAVTWHKRRCRREMPDFPLAPRSWQGSLEDAFATRRLKPDCRTCPHRGLPLNGLPVKDGAVVCPGHGLRWNLTTGELMPRVSP